MQVDGMTRLGDLVVFDANRAIVARGGGTDQAVAVVELPRRGGEHVFGRDNRHHADRWRIFDLDRPAHNNNFVSQSERRLGERLCPSARSTRS